MWYKGSWGKVRALSSGPGQMPPARVFAPRAALLVSGTLPSDATCPTCHHWLTPLLGTSTPTRLCSSPHLSPSAGAPTRLFRAWPPAAPLTRSCVVPVLPQLRRRDLCAGRAVRGHSGPPATAALPLPAGAPKAACPPALQSPALPRLVHLLLEGGEAGRMGWEVGRPQTLRWPDPPAHPPPVLRGLWRRRTAASGDLPRARPVRGGAETQQHAALQHAALHTVGSGALGPGERVCRAQGRRCSRCRRWAPAAHCSWGGQCGGAQPGEAPRGRDAAGGRGSGDSRCKVLGQE